MSQAQFFTLCGLVACAPTLSKEFAIGATAGYSIAALICFFRSK